MTVLELKDKKSTLLNEVRSLIDLARGEERKMNERVDELAENIRLFAS